MVWQASHGLWYGLVDMAWYGLVGMLWYMVWPDGHRMVYGMA